MIFIKIGRIKLMTLTIDLPFYFLALLFFILAGFNFAVTVGNPPEKVKFEWLAFAMLVLSLIF